MSRSDWIGVIQYHRFRGIEDDLGDRSLACSRLMSALHLNTVLAGQSLPNNRIFAFTSCVDSTAVKSVVVVARLQGLQARIERVGHIQARIQLLGNIPVISLCFCYLQRT